jgi:hypothetical protein
MIDCSCSEGEEDLKENLGEFCLSLEISI